MEKMKGKLTEGNKQVIQKYEYIKIPEPLTIPSMILLPLVTISFTKRPLLPLICLTQGETGTRFLTLFYFRR